MSADKELMRSALRFLFRQGGFKGADEWYASMIADAGIPKYGCRNCQQEHHRAVGMDGHHNDGRGRKRDQTLAVDLLPVIQPVVSAAFKEVRDEALQFLDTFRDELEATLHATLKESEDRIDAERIRYGIAHSDCGQTHEFRGKNTVDFQGLVGAASDLLVLQRKKTRLVEDLRNDTAHSDEIKAKVAAVDSEYNRELAGATLRYPALGAVLDESGGSTPEERLAAVATGELSGTHDLRGRRWRAHAGAGVVGNVFDSRLCSIEEVRKEVKDHRDTLWKLDSIVALTRMRLATEQMTMADTLISEKARNVKADGVFLSTVLGVLAFALALLTAIPTGGGSLAVVAGVGLAAISGYQLVKDIKEYLLDLALSSTDLNRRASAIAADEPSFLWVALDIVGFAADGVSALKGFKALKPSAAKALKARTAVEALSAAEDLEKAADALGFQKKGLGKLLRELLAKLRGRGSEALRELGDVGKAELQAVTHASEALAQESRGARTLTRVGEHELKVTRGGHLVVCSDCTWVRGRYGKELTGRLDRQGRLEIAEDKTAAGTLDRAAEDDLADLVREMEHERQARVLNQITDPALVDKLTQPGLDLGKFTELELEDLKKFSGLDASAVRKFNALSLDELQKFAGLRYPDMLARFGACDADGIAKLARLEPSVLKRFGGWEETTIKNISRQKMENIEQIAKLKVAPGQAVEGVLGGFQTQQFHVGAEVFQLHKSAMAHILERHHPQYWNSSVKVQQSFLDARMTVDELRDAIGEVMRQNRDQLIKLGTSRTYQVTGTYGGTAYTLGVTDGRIGQFFPK